MTKQIFSAVLFILLLSSCGKKGNISVSGTIENGKGKTLHLQEMTNNGFISIDSIKLSSNEKFSFHHTIENPGFYALFIEPRKYITLIIHPNDRLSISADAENLKKTYTVKGSKDSELARQVFADVEKIHLQVDSLGAIYRDNMQNPDLEKIKAGLDSAYTRIIEEAKTAMKSFIDKNITYISSMVCLYQQATPGDYFFNWETDFDYFRRVDSVLFSLYPGSESVSTLHNQFIEVSQQMEAKKKSMELLGLGKEAPNIALPDLNGNIIELHSLRGKYVLLDFWASWCSPCRKENPKLVEAYNKYSKKGFDIYQVSLDRNKEAWLSGIESDGIGQWKHVSDLQYWNSIVISIYGISSIPTNYLLDKEGRIIGNNLRGDLLDSKLKELFN